MSPNSLLSKKRNDHLAALATNKRRCWILQKAGVSCILLGCCALFSVYNNSRKLSTGGEILHQIPQSGQLQPPPQSPPSLLRNGDRMVLRGWDRSPIVLEKYKLIFFTIPKVGCTVWKQLFRRVAGFKDWDGLWEAHDPETNGLVYLSDFYKGIVNGTSPETGPDITWQMLTSPEWTKAIFVRDPKERFLSSYLDKVFTNPSHMSFCCNARIKRNALNLPNETKVYPFSTLQGCMKYLEAGMANFLELVSTTCPFDEHWHPQSRRFEPKYWDVLGAGGNNLFIGHMERAEADAKELLQRVGAWDQYGKSGWGPDGTLPIFGSGANKALQHSTNANGKLAKYYDPTLERLIDEYYAGDYEAEALNLTKVPIEYS